MRQSKTKPKVFPVVIVRPGDQLTRGQQRARRRANRDFERERQQNLGNREFKSYSLQEADSAVTWKHKDTYRRRVYHK